MTPTVRLGDLIAPAKTRRAETSVYPILSMTMRGGLVDQKNKFRKRVASADLGSYKVVARNQLVIGFPIDEGVLAFQRLYDAAVVSPAYEIWGLVDESRTDPEFLERYLRSPDALAYYAAKLQGTTARRRSLPEDILLDLPVPLPPLSKQKWVVDLLNGIDSIRAMRLGAIRSLEELSQATFLEMFGDPMSNSKGWPVRPMGELGLVATGNTPPRTSPEFYGDGIEWIKSDNIRPDSPYLTPAAERLSPLGASHARIASEGSLLVTCIAGSPNAIGNTAIADRRVAFNQQINAITPAEVDNLFLYFLLRVGKGLVQDKSTGGMKGIVNKSQFESIETIFPPPALQRDFRARVSAVLNVQKIHKRNLELMNELFESIQYRTFRGEL